MVMDAERGDEQVNLLKKPGAGVKLPPFLAPLGESPPVRFPNALHGQGEIGRPQVHLVKALGPSNGEVRLRALRAIAQVMARVGANKKSCCEQEVLLRGVDRRALAWMRDLEAYQKLPAANNASCLELLEFVIIVPPLHAA